MWRKKRSATDVPLGQRRSVPATSRQRGTQGRAQTGFVCIQWNCFCIQRGFQLLWGRWKALLAALKCLVLPAFGSMRGARTKYTTVRCKLSGKKLIQHRALWTTGKQGGVDGLPCRSPLSPRRKRAAHTVGHEPGQLKGRWGDSKCQRAATTMRNVCFRAEWTGSSYKRAAFALGRPPLTSFSRRWQQLHPLGWGEVWAPPAGHHSPPVLCSPLPQETRCFCMTSRVAQWQVSPKGVPLSESLRSSLLDQLVHPTRVIASLKYLVC